MYNATLATTVFNAYNPIDGKNMPYTAVRYLSGFFKNFVQMYLKWMFWGQRVVTPNIDLILFWSYFKYVVNWHFYFWKHSHFRNLNTVSTVCTHLGRHSLCTFLYVCTFCFQGVLRVHFLEGQDLLAKDTYLGGLIKGKSDPYGVIRIGNQLFQSKVIKDCLHPKWNEVYEVCFVVSYNV